MTTDMTEKCLEDLIVAAMTGKTSPAGSGDIGERHIPAQVAADTAYQKAIPAAHPG